MTLTPETTTQTLQDRCWLQQIAAAAATPHRREDARTSSLDWWESRY